MSGLMLPKAIREANAQADEVEQQLRQQMQEGTPSAEAPGQSPAPSSQQPGQQPEGTQQSTASSPPETTQTPGTPDASTRVQHPTPGFESVSEEQRQKNWEQSYRVIEGKYRSEVPRLQEALRVASQENNLLRSDLLSLKEQVNSIQQQSQPKQPDQPAQPAASPIDIEKLRTEYPDEMIKLFETVNQQNAQMQQMSETIQRQNQLLQSTQQRVERVNQDQVQTREQQFNSRLSGLCPEWEQINNDPAFAGWLDQMDEDTGLVRRNLAQHHFNAMNAPMVAKFYNAFKSQFYGQSSVANSQQQQSQQQPVTQQPKQQTQSQVQQQPTRTDLLDLQMEPDRAGGETKVTDSKKRWSETEVKQFEKDLRDGKYRGRDAERRNIENDIARAAFEGRLDFNPFMPGITNADMARLNSR